MSTRVIVVTDDGTVQVEPTGESILLAIKDLKLEVEKIMTTQAELAAALDSLNDKLTKIGSETTALLAAIADLKVQVQNAENVSPALQAAFDRVAAHAQAVDDLVPDVPPAPTPTPAPTPPSP